jgi:hypothetical protein
MERLFNKNKDSPCLRKRGGESQTKACLNIIASRLTVGTSRLSSETKGPPYSRRRLLQILKKRGKGIVVVFFLRHDVTEEVIRCLIIFLARLLNNLLVELDRTLFVLDIL